MQFLPCTQQFGEMYLIKTNKQKTLVSFTLFGFRYQHSNYVLDLAARPQFNLLLGWRQITQTFSKTLRNAMLNFYLKPHGNVSSATLLIKTRNWKPRVWISFFTDDLYNNQLFCLFTCKLTWRKTGFYDRLLQITNSLPLRIYTYVHTYVSVSTSQGMRGGSDGSDQKSDTSCHISSSRRRQHVFNNKRLIADGLCPDLLIMFHYTNPVAGLPTCILSWLWGHEPASVADHGPQWPWPLQSRCSGSRTPWWEEGQLLSSPSCFAFTCCSSLLGTFASKSNVICSQ